MCISGQQCPPKYYVLAEIECYHDAPIATTETVGNDTITFPPKAPRPREPYNLTDSTNATETSINSTTHVFSTPIYPHDDDDDDNYGQGPYTEGWILFIVAICSIPIICCVRFYFSTNLEKCRTS